MRKGLLIVAAFSLIGLAVLWVVPAVRGAGGGPQMLSTGRPITAAEQSKLAGEVGPDLARWHADALNFVGVPAKLSSADLGYYRNRGTSETFLLHYLSQFGVSPAEHRALARAGVDLAVKRPQEAGLFHWAALSDLVVVGEVVAVEGRPGGVYHSEVEVTTGKVLKDCTGEAAGAVVGKLLETGPRTHEGHDHWVDSPIEPNLLEGEKVVVLLSRTPIQLIQKVASAGANNDFASLQQEHGSLPSLVQALNAPDGLEILQAYKVVGDTAVTKVRGLRVPLPTDVVKMAELETRVRALAQAQRPFCEQRGS